MDRRQFIKSMALIPLVKLPEMNFVSVWTMWETGNMGNISLIKNGKTLIKDGCFTPTMAKFIREGGKGDKLYYITFDGKTIIDIYEEVRQQTIINQSYDWCYDIGFDTTFSKIENSFIVLGLDNFPVENFIELHNQWGWDFDEIMKNNVLSVYEI